LKEIAPPHSYVHVEEYKSLENLVKYINYLDNNDDAYMEYFQWRKVLEDSAKWGNGFFDTSKLLPPYKTFLKSTPLGFCDLCKKLTTNKFENPKAIKSLKSLWYDRDHPECVN